MASISVAGDSSGSISIAAPSAAGSGVLTLPTGTDTLVGKATTDTLTNKSIAATQLTGTIAAAALPAGSVLQVVSASYNTANSTSSASYVTTNLTASITPRSASNKILVIATLPTALGSSTYQITATIYRGATNIALSGGSPNGFGASYSPSAGTLHANLSMLFLDSPATTSSTTYTIYYASTNGGSVTTFQNNETGTITLMEIAV